MNISREARTDIHILLIEDDPVTQMLATNILRKLGRVTVCQDLKQAVGEYLRLMPDLVFLDIDLGDGKRGGFDVLSTLRMHDEDANIVMLSGKTTADILAEAVCEGAAGFVQKPFRAGHLVRYAQDCQRRKDRRHGS